MSVADLLDDWFEHAGLKGSIASTGVVGVWAGPRTPGTAYNLLHHALGEIDGIPGGWGQVIGGMGAISQAIARSAEAAGAEIRTGAPVASIDVRDGRVVGVTLADGEEIRAPIVASGAHPKTTILDLAGAEHFPEDVARDMRRYRTRGGSVKINLVLSEAPRYEGVTDEQQHMLERTGVNLCPSIDYLERAWQDALAGRPATAPYVEAELPSAIDSSLTDDGRWVMTMFTQYGPPGEEAWEGDARERYADACVEHLARYAPNVPGAILEREVLAPPDLERIFGLVDGSIFQGEQGLDQMAFMRPSPGLARYSTPVHGLYLCGAGTHPGRRRDGGLGPQRRTANPSRPPLPASAKARFDLLTRGQPRLAVAAEDELAAVVGERFRRLLPGEDPIGHGLGPQPPVRHQLEHLGDRRPRMRAARAKGGDLRVHLDQRDGRLPVEDDPGAGADAVRGRRAQRERERGRVGGHHRGDGKRPQALRIALDDLGPQVLGLSQPLALHVAVDDSRRAQRQGDLHPVQADARRAAGDQHLAAGPLLEPRRHEPPAVDDVVGHAGGRLRRHALG